MTRRKRRTTDLCHCGHEYDDHTWGFKGEREPCGICAGCCDFLADGLPADPDEKHDREAEAAR